MSILKLKILLKLNGNIEIKTEDIKPNSRPQVNLDAIPFQNYCLAIHIAYRWVSLKTIEFLFIWTYNDKLKGTSYHQFKPFVKFKWVVYGFVGCYDSRRPDNMNFMCLFF